MKILKMVVGALLTILLCHHLSGCASFKKNQLNTVDVLPPLSSKHEKQDLTYTFTSWVDDGHIEKEKNRERIYADEFTSALNDSGYFSILEPGDNRDIRIQAVLLVSYSGNLVSLGTGLTFMTLGLLPSWTTVTYKATVKVTTGDGQDYEYILEDRVTKVRWFAMIFVASSRKPNEVSSGVRKNIYKNLLLKMQEDGVFI
jgi:hypothetical protein